MSRKILLTAQDADGRLARLVFVAEEDWIPMSTKQPKKFEPDKFLEMEYSDVGANTTYVKTPLNIQL